MAVFSRNSTADMKEKQHLHRASTLEEALSPKPARAAFSRSRAVRSIGQQCRIERAQRKTSARR
jgi:hypothetical protein